MLAKLWKKIALAVCIIAILFNITYKLVHRTNLKEQLTSVIGGEAISFSEQTSEQTAADEKIDTGKDNN